MKILVTGANGFIGANLCRTLTMYGHEILGLVRCEKAHNSGLGKCDFVEVGDLDECDNLSKYLKNIDCVIHLAGSAHQLNNTESETKIKSEKDKAAHELIVESAIKSGVKRFIYMSSIKVYGENSSYLSSQVITEESKVGGECDVYGETKLRCEHFLTERAKQSGMEYVIIRPPLVYGEGVRANFKKLLWLANSYYPIPFRAFSNKRSMVSSDNLVDMVNTCCTSPLARNQIYLVSDCDDKSVCELFISMRKEMNLPSNVFYVPTQWIKLVFRLLAKEDVFLKLHPKLQVSCHKALNQLKWSPPIKSGDALVLAVRAYLQGTK